MTNDDFHGLIESEAQLRALLGVPGNLAVGKELPALDRHGRAFIAQAPLVLLGTCAGDGRCDVSPRGDAPGFVEVLDDQRLVIPERPGNKRFDSLRNILETGRIGLLFMVPGVEETLRVNGRAVLTREPALLARLQARGKLPWLAIGVTVEETFLHCAKALKRSALWQTQTWPRRGALPTLAEMLLDQIRPTDAGLGDYETAIAESYAKRLY